MNCLLSRAKSSSLAVDQREPAWKEVRKWTHLFLQNNPLISSTIAHKEKLKVALEEIADEAVVSPATVYNYYGNKSELLLALVARGEESTRSKLPEFELRVLTD